MGGTHTRVCACLPILLSAHLVAIKQKAEYVLRYPWHHVLLVLLTVQPISALCFTIRGVGVGVCADFLHLLLSVSCSNTVVVVLSSKNVYTNICQLSNTLTGVLCLQLNALHGPWQCKQLLLQPAALNFRWPWRAKRRAGNTSSRDGPCVWEF